jgi:hypothetical protein
MINKFVIIGGLLVVVVVGVLAFRFLSPTQNPQTQVKTTPTPTQMLVGGDRDAYGCIPSAGYSWCEITQKCYRPWEEKCESSSSSVPLPRGEDIIRSFFALINDKRIPDAVSMMAPSSVPDESAKQAWGVQFNALNSVKITSMTPSDKANWNTNQEIYQVNLATTVNPNSKNAPIPYYGWNDGTDTKWIEIEKVGKIWKIKGIATGP